MIIYFDMDGVLADLDTHIVNLVPDLTLEALASIRSKGSTKAERTKFFTEYLPYYAERSGFVDAPLMPNAVELVDEVLEYSKKYFAKVAILTSHGDFHYPADIVYQKKRWINSYMPQLKNVPFCATPSGKAKADLANEHAYLIDDHYANLDHFAQNGGYGYVYERDSSTKEVIADIMKSFNIS